MRAALLILCDACGSDQAKDVLRTGEVFECLECGNFFEMPTTDRRHVRKMRRLRDE